MFDIGATEMLLVVIVALLVIGPKDLPLAMRTAGRWMGKLRGMTKHFRSGIDAMIREAEIEEQEKLWAERNAKIMREHPPENVMREGEGAFPEGSAASTPTAPATSDDAAAPAGARQQGDGGEDSPPAPDKPE